MHSVCPNSRQASKSQSDGVRKREACPKDSAPRPQPTPETKHFWDGTRAGELRLQRCNACQKAYFPPRPFCPHCAAREVASSARAAEGRLYSYVIHHRPVPGFTPPYAIAVVELDEGPRMMTNIVECPQTPEALVLDMPLEVAFEKTGRRDHAAVVPPGERLTPMKPKSIAIVGAAETTELGRIPDLSQIGLHADAALNAMKDGGLSPPDIDGVATAGETPVTVAHYLGITPKWVDGTAVGGCSFMIHVRHAAAAIEAGLCKTVLITHGESGRSGVGVAPARSSPGEPRRPVRAAVRADGAADALHDPGAALHEDLRR